MVERLGTRGGVEQASGGWVGGGERMAAAPTGIGVAAGNGGGGGGGGETPGEGRGRAIKFTFVELNQPHKEAAFCRCP